MRPSSWVIPSPFALLGRRGIIFAGAPLNENQCEEGDNHSDM